ncbi:MAG: glycosyltransferase family 1 protein [Chloroflexota bacterium]|nr:glycosyltransferase family 1 protein [Chloroflexota bacterium]
MQIELVTHNPSGKISGIGRYINELYQALQPQIDVRIVPDVMPPLVKQFSILQHFPVGIQGHERGSIAHFMQIMGCSQMLWHPTHPAVATVHDLGVLICKEDEALFDWIGRKTLEIQWSGLRRMDQFVAVSQFTATSLIEQFGIPAERVHVVYNGVDPAHFRPVADSLAAARTQARAELEPRYPLFRDSAYRYHLLYTGTELPRKNLRTLLEALSILKQRGVSVRLIKVGGSGGDRWREAFQAQIRTFGVENEVALIGSVSDDDLVSFYNSADIVVTASLLEGFGLPVLEAMACGAPVVCSTGGALPEIVGDAAITCDPRDASGFADAIAQLLGDSQRQEDMRRRGLLRSRQFSWTHSVEPLIKIYARLAA